MGRLLIVTNDFPPRRGGIETFVYECARRFPSDDVVVYTSRGEGDERFDARLPFRVVRDPSRVLLPTPTVAARARALITSYDCDRVWFGAAAPLGLLAGRLGLPAVATAHGHEDWWARLPGTRAMLRRIGARVTTVTYLSERSRRRITPAFRCSTARLVPGVDVTMFRPDVDGDAVRRAHGLGRRPVVLSVSRLVARKGHDRLIRAMPAVRRAVPGAMLLIVGGGPQGFWLRGLAGAVAPGMVVFAGPVDHADLPPYYAAADAFAMPSRDRLLGLETEGLGIVALEAAAAGLPVLAGTSGGAPDTVEDGITGLLAGPDDDLAPPLVRLLTDTTGMGRKGRARVEREWTWDRTHARLSALLDDARTLR
ncbi:glycosyltransferase family 4 protein [Actinomadura flavalba]|uniref:glycosyltransferase family 4 protein n=1 Tax=Actinomadura flavalba TaxID=1120938 RepID=UPI000369DDC1|nr:glycosyltransferase family 4 protein [Actinomadura flavalba]